MRFWIKDFIPKFIISILKSRVILAIGLALSGAIYSQIALSFDLNRIFFSTNENGTLKQNNQSHDAITSHFWFRFLTNRLVAQDIMVLSLCSGY